MPVGVCVQVFLMESPQRTPTTEDGPTLSISNKPNKSIASKLNKILNSSTIDDTRTKLALTSLSDIPGLDEASLRRNLRGTIEKKEVETNKKFLEAFGKVVMVIIHKYKKGVKRLYLENKQLSNLINYKVKPKECRILVLL